METKICTKCKEEKALTSFYKDKSKPSGHYSSCKSCVKIYTETPIRQDGQRAHDHNRVETVITRNRARQRYHKDSLVAFHGGECMDCHKVYMPFIMEFDHRDPSKKSFNISGSRLNYAWERLLQESLKCDLVCSNCHRVRTHRLYCKEGCTSCGI